MTPTVDRMVGARLGLGDNDGAGSAQARHRRRIAGRPPSAAFLLFSLADEPCGVDPVLDRDRPSVKGAPGE